MARERGIAWLQVDDLRLALQYSHATIPEGSDALYWFLRRPGFAHLPVEEVRDAYVGVARAMLPAVRVAIESHVITDVPMILEGDGIIPDLVDDPAVAPLVAAGVVRFCCVEAPSADALMQAMLERGRGEQEASLTLARRMAEAIWAYNAWLVGRSEELNIPVVSSHPWSTLVSRIASALD
jgi:2-phosphoglycerate kinase